MRVDGAVAECYANKCLARLVLEELRKRGVSICGVKHAGVGGDLGRVVRAAGRWLEERSGTLLVVVDREEGAVPRAFERVLCREVVMRSSSFPVKLCRTGRWGRRGPSTVLAVVLEPNAEEAVVCRIDPRYCRDPALRSKIKSGEACDEIEKLRERDPRLKKLVESIAEAVLAALTG